jgi:hypothetical protein
VNLRKRVVNLYQMSSKPGLVWFSGISLPETWVLGRWRPAWRRREPGPGFRTELREPVALMAREKHKWQKPRGESTEAEHWDGPTVRAMKAGNAAGAKESGQAVALGVQLATGGDR